MTHRIDHQRARRLPWIALTMAALAFVPAPRAEAVTIVPGTTITVDTVSDGFILVPPWQPAPPPPCRLRDAIEAANTNQKVGGCPAGKRARLVSFNPTVLEDVDQIVFDVGTGTPDIVLRNGLPPITDSVTIDGATGGATRVEISGENVWGFFGPVQGVVVTGTFTTLKSLVVNGFSGSGIVLTAEDGDGIVIVTPGRPERPDSDEISGQLDPCGPKAFPSDPSQCPPPGGFPDDDVTTVGGPGGGSNTVVDCLVGTNAAGNAAVPNGTGLPDSAGIMVLNSGNTIGSVDPKLGNVISGNRGHGVLLQGVNNHLINNKIGTGISTNVGLGNELDGVFVTGGQFAGATCEILGNTIFYNHGDGIDAGYNVCTLLANRISGNGELGIERAEDGVTPNDPTATLHRRPPNFPEIWRVTMSFVPQRTTISGVIHQRSPNPITVELFYSSSCDPSGNGEGASYLGSTQVAFPSPSSTQPAVFSFSTNKIFVAGYYTATATTEQGTSEFSVCYR
jgi:hypothetical protein